MIKKTSMQESIFKDKQQALSTPVTHTQHTHNTHATHTHTHTQHTRNTHTHTHTNTHTHTHTQTHTYTHTHTHTHTHTILSGAPPVHGYTPRPGVCGVIRTRLINLPQTTLLTVNSDTRSSLPYSVGQV